MSYQLNPNTMLNVFLLLFKYIWKVMYSYSNTCLNGVFVFILVFMNLQIIRIRIRLHLYVFDPMSDQLIPSSHGHTLIRIEFGIDSVYLSRVYTTKYNSG